MIPRPPISTLTSTLFPYTTRFRSAVPLRSNYRQAEGICAQAFRSAQERQHARQRAARAGRCDHHPRKHVLKGARVNALYDELRIALHAVWQRRWTALAAAWAICLLGWLAVAQIPNSYDSHARVFVQMSSILPRSAEHTSELQSLLRISYAVFC